MSLPSPAAYGRPFSAFSVICFVTSVSCCCFFFCAIRQRERDRKSDSRCAYRGYRGKTGLNKNTGLLREEVTRRSPLAQRCVCRAASAERETLGSGRQRLWLMLVCVCTETKLSERAGFSACHKPVLENELGVAVDRGSAQQQTRLSIQHHRTNRLERVPLLRTGSTDWWPAVCVRGHTRRLQRSRHRG